MSFLGLSFLMSEIKCLDSISSSQVFDPLKYFFLLGHVFSRILSTNKYIGYMIIQFLILFAYHNCQSDL